MTTTTFQRVGFAMLVAFLLVNVVWAGATGPKDSPQIKTVDAKEYAELQIETQYADVAYC
ncbi:hypothetical protein HDV05_001066, partial [Chytridiales sp. JEL 0842]